MLEISSHVGKLREINFSLVVFESYILVTKKVKL